MNVITSPLDWAPHSGAALDWAALDWAIRKRIPSLTGLLLRFGCVLLLLGGAGAGKALAQDSCDELVAIPEAEKRYARGNFDDVLTLLLPCTEKGFSENARIQSLKILSMTYLAIDSLQQSARTIDELLTLNPKYEPDFGASPRYRALFQQVRDSQDKIVQVTSVSKKAENILYVPATVMVLTSRDFEQRGYQSLEQMLHDLPGFDVMKGNGPGYSIFYQRGYRSISNDRTLILIDGVEENDLVSNNVPISQQYALSDIDRIEVIYGPASTLYGANAFVGVINVITKSFRNLAGPSRQLAFTGQARAGSLNTQFFDGVLTAKTPDVALSVTARVYRSEEIDLSRYPEWDYASRTVTDYTNQLNQTIDDKADNPLLSTYANSGLYTIASGGTGKKSLVLTDQGRAKAAQLDNTLFGRTGGFSDNSYDWLIRAKLEFKDLTISLLNWRTNEGALPWYTNRSALPVGNNPRWITEDRAFSITYNKYISDKFQLTNIASFLLHEINGNSSLVNYRGYYNGQLGLLQLARDSLPRAVPTYQYRISNQLRNEMRFFYTPVTNLEINGGLEFRRSLIQGNYLVSSTPPADETGVTNVASGTVTGGNTFQTADLGIYAQLSYRPRNDLKLVGGLRVDNNQIRSSGGYGTVMNPRLAVIYNRGPLVFKVIYATAFKDASFLQKYATTTSRTLTNPTLPPERVKNIDIGGSWQFTRQLSLNVIGYRATYNNAVGTATVTLAPNVTTQQFQAIGSRRIWGVQGEVSYKTDRLNAWGNFTYTEPMDPVSEERISDIASYMLNAGAHYQLTSTLGLYLAGNYVGPRRTGKGTVGSSNPQTEFAPFLVLNANLMYRTPLRGLAVQAAVNNLLDHEYFVPGIREADNLTYPSRFPQNRRFLSAGLYYTLRPK